MFCEEECTNITRHSALAQFAGANQYQSLQYSKPGFLDNDAVLLFRYHAATDALDPTFDARRATAMHHLRSGTLIFSVESAKVVLNWHVCRSVQKFRTALLPFYWSQVRPECEQCHCATDVSNYLQKQHIRHKPHHNFFFYNQEDMPVVLLGLLFVRAPASAACVKSVSLVTFCLFLFPCSLQACLQPRASCGAPTAGIITSSQQM